MALWAVKCTVNVPIPTSTYLVTTHPTGMRKRTHVQEYCLSMALQVFVEPWPFCEFLEPVHSRQDSLDGRSARRKAVTYTLNNTNTE
jgi:hypothetical protein